MKVLYLVIASSDPTHLQDELTQRATWASSSSTNSIWLRGGKTTYFNQDSRNLYVDLEETYSNILLKTLKGINWCLANLHFDFMIRANVSTYFDVNRVHSLLHDFSPSRDFFGGYLDFRKNPQNCGLSNVFVNGGALFFSHKTLTRLEKMREEEWTNLPDDYAISQFLLREKVLPTQIPRGNISNTSVLTARAYYRAKSSSNSIMASLRMRILHEIKETSFTLRKLLLYGRFYGNELRYFKANYSNPIGYLYSLYSFLSATTKSRRLLNNDKSRR